jgi:SagB-type dehydrogenase family enzyme
MIAMTAAADADFDAPEQGVLVVRRAGGEPTRLRLSPPTVTVLLALVDGPVPVADLPADPPAHAALLRLARLGLLHLSAVVDRREVVRATLTGALSRFDVAADPGAAAVRLSRFVLIRRHDDDMVMDAPVTGARITLPDLRALTVIGELARARTVVDLTDSLLDCSPELIWDTVRLLMAVGAAAAVDADGLLAEDRHTGLRQRELPDALVHAASRAGLTDQPIGATYPFLRALPPPLPQPAPASPTAAVVSLPRPDLAVLRAADPPLAVVMEDRRSARGFGNEAVTVSQLGEFLFRVARIRAERRSRGLPDEPSDRPYPSGGGACDLEFYLTVVGCPGLAPGIWHYQPSDHALALVNGDRGAVLRMLADAHRPNGSEAAPQVLITLASRWERLTWKYRGIAYALTLKNVGVLYATMQLAATAMGLGGCPLGTGNAALFAEVTGIDPAVESSVGEFLLGSVPAGVETVYDDADPR